jgi:hypothetical protein
MCSRVFAVIFIIIALILAVTASLLPQDKLASIIYITRFFDIMLPVLAVGALIKYLFTYNWANCKTTEVKTNTNSFTK